LEISGCDSWGDVTFRVCKVLGNFTAFSVYIDNLLEGGFDDMERISES
jgi:hypothetical protein